MNILIKNYNWSSNCVSKLVKFKKRIQQIAMRVNSL